MVYPPGLFQNLLCCSLSRLPSPPFHQLGANLHIAKIRTVTIISTGRKCKKSSTIVPHLEIWCVILLTVLSRYDVSFIKQSKTREALVDSKHLMKGSSLLGLVQNGSAWRTSASCLPIIQPPTQRTWKIPTTSRLQECLAFSTSSCYPSSFLS